MTRVEPRIAEPDHGGGIDAACARWGGTRADWLDLSTGINPRPYPIPPLPADAWTALPDRAAFTALEQAARRFWAIPDGAALIAAPGASALIARIPALLPPGKVAIPAPTYNEHARAFRACLTALSRPGTIVPLTGSQPPAPLSVAAGTLLLTLLDGTTSVFLAPSHDRPALRDWITFHCGAPFAAPEDATFALGTWAALQPVTRFAIGQPDYPDRACTLIVECDSLGHDGPRLRGPGIKGSARLSLPEPMREPGIWRSP